MPQPTRSLKILVAEDNPVNQRVAVLLLEKQGHQVTLAGTGKEAMVCLGMPERETHSSPTSNPFDLVLMDVEMPEMSGLEATRAIRELELGTGRHIPIIAMTAHAMKGDRELCLEAGMDGYLPKPIQSRQLFEAIEHWAPPSAPAQPETGSEVVADQVFNTAGLLTYIRGDMEFLKEFVGLFEENSSKLVREIHAAIAAGDALRLRRSAHTLAGSVSLFGASIAFEAAQKLEALGAQGNLTGALEIHRTLEESLRGLKRALAGLVK